MKKYFYFFLAVAALSATSCSKTFNCYCEDDFTGEVTHDGEIKAINYAAASTKCLTKGAKAGSEVSCSVN